MPPRIVVGVDGSDNARRGLEWAIDEAKLRGARLVVVSAWEIPSAVLASPVATAAFDVKSWSALAEDTLDEALRGVDLSSVSGGWDRCVTEGPAAHVLLEAATGADLIVLGSRGRGGFLGLLLGSVSQHVAQHAPCPVVIVPPGA
jgi:nucleotide-binding universal stress UspA family protein